MLSGPVEPELEAEGLALDGGIGPAFGRAEAQLGVKIGYHLILLGGQVITPDLGRSALSSHLDDLFEDRILQPSSEHPTAHQPQCEVQLGSPVFAQNHRDQPVILVLVSQPG